MDDDAAVTALSMKQLSLIIGIVLAVMGGATAALGYVFASKDALQEVELRLADTGNQKLRDWRINTLEIKFNNIDSRLQKMDTNLAALLIRFRVVPAPEPTYLPLPSPPKE